MDYEKKYKEALERAREWYNKTEPDSYTCIVESIFPELKESEDERVRKELVNYFTEGREFLSLCSFGRDKILAWLEKQESLTTDIEKQGKEDVLWCIKQAKKYAKDENEMGTCWFAEQWLENQGNKPQGKKALEAIKEEKIDNANKVEPKFNEGDILKHNKANIICKVLSANVGFYCLMNILGGNEMELSNVEKNFHLWTIKDAKDGDVLYLKHDGKEHIIIYKGVIKERFRTFISAYCAYNGIVDAFCFADVSRYADIAYGSIMPATRKQRDLLFKKIHEAGYMWNSDSKQLLSLKAEPNNEKKPAWSKEDEELLKCSLYNLREIEQRFGAAYGKVGKCMDWLKSLKERVIWKPSNKQIRALRWVLNNIPYNKHKEEISGLLEQIKDL